MTEQQSELDVLLRQSDLAAATRFDTPIPCRGALGWWRPSAEVLAALPEGWDR